MSSLLIMQAFVMILWYKKFEFYLKSRRRQYFE